MSPDNRPKTPSGCCEKPTEPRAHPFLMTHRSLFVMRTRRHFLILSPLNAQAAASLICEHTCAPQATEVVAKPLAYFDMSVDAGANLGCFSLFACNVRRGDVPVKTVGPHDELSSLIKTSVEMTGFTGREVVCAAPGPHSGIIDYMLLPRNSGLKGSLRHLQRIARTIRTYRLMPW